MGSLLGWLWGDAQKKRPPRVETDLVVPMRFFDDNATLRSIVFAWMFRVDDVLDPDKIHAAVSRLLEIPSWKQLGGRLRLNDHGRLEIHIPVEFTAARPAVRFSQTDYQMRLSEHPQGRCLPQSTAAPSLQPGALDFKLFGARPGAPSTLDDYLYSDEPQIAVHLSSFTDATLVSFSYPHTLTDAMGMASLLSAISLVLAGRDSEVRDLRDPSDDILKHVGTSTDNTVIEPYTLANQRVGALAGIRFGLNYAWDAFWRPEMENRTMFLPASFVKKLRELAEAELPNFGEKKPDFISDGDVLSAWGFLAITSSQPSFRPAIILNVLNARGRLPSVFKDSDPFVQNLTFNSNALFSAQDVVTASLGSVAAKVRIALTQQTTEAQVRAIVRESRASYLATGHPPLFGEANARLIVVSNWNKAKLFESVDFSPAVVESHQTLPREKLPSGRLVYHHAHSLNEARATRNFLNIVGKDLNGDYWLSGIIPPKAWQKLEEDIKSESA